MFCDFSNRFLINFINNLTMKLTFYYGLTIFSQASKIFEKLIFIPKKFISLSKRRLLPLTKLYITCIKIHLKTYDRFHLIEEYLNILQGWTKSFAIVWHVQVWGVFINQAEQFNLCNAAIVVTSLVVVNALTCCALFYSVYDLNALLCIWFEWLTDESATKSKSQTWVL